MSDLSSQFSLTRHRGLLSHLGLLALGLAIAVLLGWVAAEGKQAARADREGLQKAWSQVEARYDVTVLDRSIVPPSTEPVTVPMVVRDRRQQCSVQAVASEVLVFCGADSVEAPRR
jgi:hypothetical protein